MYVLAEYAFLLQPGGDLGGLIFALNLAFWERFLSCFSRASV